MTTKWIEVSLQVIDGEAAEAVAELLARYGHQGVSIEQNGIMPNAWDDGEVPPPDSLTVRAYLPADDRAEEAKLQLATALGHMSLMYPMPTPYTPSSMKRIGRKPGSSIITRSGLAGAQ
jgi:ribosomal protein L11 methylase PrmA